MPELPEVETVARTLSPHIRDHVITGVSLLRPSTLHHLSLPLESLIGMRLTGAGRRGKLLLLNLAATAAAKASQKPDLLVSHLRMTGRMLAKAANEEPGKHTRCFFDLEAPDGARARLFFDDIRTFGKIMATTPELLAAWPFWRDLGPEPLEMDARELCARLKGGRPIKQALLDQTVLAGIGNIYADESLFLAGVSPLRPANSLGEEETGRLLDSIQAVLRLSIEQCGSSIRDYRDANGDAGAFQNSFNVYGRGGELCKKCGKPLIKCKVGGRATVYCSGCQI